MISHQPHNRPFFSIFCITLALIVGQMASASVRPLFAEGAPAGRLTLQAQTPTDESDANRLAADLSALPVEVLGIETTQNYLGPLWRNDVSVWMTLSAISGQPLTLTVPTLITLARQSTDQTRIQAQFDRVSVTDEQDERLLDRIVLSAGQPQRVQFTVHDLTNVGVYNGAVQIGAAGAAPIRTSITFLVKRWWGSAATLILLGVLLGFVLRIYSTLFRPRLLGQRQLLILRQNLKTVFTNLGEPPPGDAGRQEAEVRAIVQRNFGAHLSTLETDLQLGVAATSGQAGLDEMTTKLNLLSTWVKYHRSVAALQPAELREPFRARLQTAQNMLVAPLPSADPAQATKDAIAATAALNSLDSEIEQAIRTKLGSQIEALRAEVEQTPELTDTAARSKILSVLTEAEAQIDMNLAEARAQFNAAQADYARLLAHQLQEEITNAAPPLGFTSETWTELKTRVNTALEAAIQATDAATALELYRGAYRDYLGTLTQNLQQMVAAQRDLQPAQAARLDAMQQALTLVAQALAAGEFQQAAQSYADVQAEFKQFIESTTERPRSAAQPVEAAPGATTNVVQAAQAGATTAPAVIELALPLPRTLRGVITALLIGDLVRLIITIFVAVLAGLLLLWVDNPIWGNANDLIVALLWGFGLHQLSATTFEGVNSLPGRLWGAGQQ